MALGDLDDPIPVKQNDTRPVVRYKAFQGTPPVPVDLNGVGAVWNMRTVTQQGGTIIAGGTVVARAPATIADPDNGLMEYVPTAAWSPTNGLHQAEFEVSLSDGGILTFPPGAQYIYLQISDDIA